MNPAIRKWLIENGWVKSGREWTNHWTRKSDGSGIQKMDRDYDWYAYPPSTGHGLGPFANARKAAESLPPC